VRNIDGYNARMSSHPNEKLPTILVVVDELAELMGKIGPQIDQAVQSLTQKARACGIHLLFATQRPSTDVISGDIKANFKVRLCLQVADKTASRVALDTDGAEKLRDKGDALLYWPGRRLQRIHCPMMPEAELTALIERWRSWAVEESWEAVDVLDDRKEETGDGSTPEGSGTREGVSAVESTAESVEATQRASLAKVEQDPVLRDAAILAVSTGKLSGAGLLKHLRGKGHRIGKDRVYAEVLPALESAGILRLAGQGVPPEVIADSLPFLPSETV
jgi:S-DNA-T family DNA segregation ATPase FtsK/SpoIIIE